VADDLVERLARLDTCAVSDALDRLGLPGAVNGLRPMWPCPRTVGRVVTVKLKRAGGRPLSSGKPSSGDQSRGGQPPIARSENASPASEPPTHPARHLGTAAVEAASPGDVIVVDHGGRLEAAGWGGILSLAAKVKGVAGVIVDGACRDVDESRDVELPIYARAGTPVTARGRIVEESFNEPIRVGHVAVHPGDLVIADWSGVVFVTQDRADEIVSVAEEIAAREAQMAEAVRAGRSVVEVMGASYENLLHGPAPEPRHN
jgi:4-hydroxy-4-methyl-2-oxoglutarate aldolase